MLGNILFLALQLRSTSLPQSTPTQINHIAFIDALLNSMTKGEGALKHTCYQVRHTNEKMTFVEKEQCRQATKEVDFSKRQFPIALSFVKSYKRDNLEQTGAKIRYLSASSKFIKDCKSEKNIRAAKTMRYWGTDEVGDWKYSNLTDLGANDYKIVLDACKSNSWVYKKQNLAENALAGIANEVSQADYVPSCKAVQNGGNWSQVQQTENISILNQLVNKSGTLRILTEQSEISSVNIIINSTTIGNKQKQISQSASFCESAIALGTKSLEKQKRDKIRALAAKKEAERNYQRALEAQRKAAAAEARRQQKIKSANEGVELD